MSVSSFSIFFAPELGFTMIFRKPSVFIELPGFFVCGFIIAALDATFTACAILLHVQVQRQGQSLGPLLTGNPKAAGKAQRSDDRLKIRSMKF
jgi:hypothetical protein